MVEKEDYKKAYEQGKQAGSSFEFTLTIQCQDIDAFVADPEHRAGMIGTVTAKSLSSSPLFASSGVFNLFVREAGTNAKKMKYDMKLSGKDNKVYFFSGFKDIQDNKGFDLWSDTSVLFITIYDGPGSDSPVIGKGMLKIEINDFKAQLTTMKAVHAPNKVEGMKAVGKFGKLFAGNLWDTYVK